MDVKLVNPNFESNYVENLLRARGVGSIEDYVDPQPYELQDPKDLKNIGIGAALYNRIVLNDKPPYSRILLIIDSDVDGFSSAAIFYLFTKQVNCHCQIDYWLHSGKQHGLQDHIERLMSENIEYDLIVCPDSSSNDATYHDMLSEIKIPCLVLDHHLTDVKLSDNAVVINNQISPNYRNKELVGAGVTFQFCRYIDSLLGSHFVDKLIDLAALGQIGDMGSVLTLENRYIIKEGLSHIQNKMFRAILEKQSYSITGIINASWEEIVEKTNPISVAFYVVPLINAVIRVGTMEEKELLFKAFLNGDEMVPCNKRGAKGTLERACVEATRIATNARAHQNKFLDAAVEKLEARIFKYDLLENKILCIVLDDTDTFPSELNGLLAMRLSAKYHHPTMVVRENDQGYLRGSMRGLSNNKFSNFKDYLQSTGLFEYVMG